MIQLILLLLGLAFPNENSTIHNNTPVTIQTTSHSPEGLPPGNEDGEPVGGNSGQLPPPLFTFQ
ncbi:hypothetical protein [Chryseobacterium sp. Mn2064]|uniref:hypothetical protein n=1 Tax=Chryseobacterium sp. Mn2064 TaxID=3395263 RepID=UPI003BD18AB6